MNKIEKQVPRRWEEFVKAFPLTPEQKEQFQTYAEMLLTENKNINLTAITEPGGVVRHHFHDSLQLMNRIDMNTITSIGDVGAGAGFPVLPLKIMFPHLRVLLIEMNGKKQRFLRQVCAALGLKDVEVAEYDWRTFLRVTEGEVDLFVSRAALSTRELCRVFKPGSAYKKTTMVYWASINWEPESQIEKNVVVRWPYTLGSRDRVLAVLQGEQPQLTIRKN